MKKLTGTFPSTTGLCDIHYYIYTPEKPKALVMLSHGMCEYIERYEGFAEFLCQNGIILCGNDHVGHGNSITDEDMLGFFGHERGYINMTRDLHRMKLIVEKLYPDIPHFLIGHSMGSFLARIYFSKFSDRWKGFIISGTSGGVAGSAPLSSLLNLLSFNHGDRYRHNIAAKLIFGSFNLRTQRRTKNDWLSRDEENVDRYNADPKCNFTFTLAGFRDLLSALLCANSEPVFDNTPINIPILMMSGEMDPIGEYGKGVRTAYTKYVNHGCDIELMLYPEARHELLFELNRDEVMERILSFINSNMTMEG